MLLRPMQSIIFKFIWISVDGEIIENDMKTIVWTENISGQKLHFQIYRN